VFLRHRSVSQILAGLRVGTVARYALNIGTVTILLAGCGGSQPPIGAPGAMPQSGLQGLAAQRSAAQAEQRSGGASKRFQVLHTFSGSSDGRSPLGSMTDLGDVLYGTTYEGGLHGYGIVFSIAADGTEKTLYSFGQLPDGEKPAAGLVALNGQLYGTTENGGAYECRGSEYTCGTVFVVDSKGHEHVVHSFGRNSDGVRPAANLINVQGTLYGTTVNGGTYGGGTVFSISPDGSEKVVYSFGSYSNDGYSPWAGIVYLNGVLYGTTEIGGTHVDGGTVYSITPDGVEHVLHDFGATGDGAVLLGGLTDLGGILYGTTVGGGAYGGGTVFSISTSGDEKVLHSFGAGTDGSTPQAALTASNDVLYGTTSKGGADGGGTVFTINTAGNERVVFSFHGSSGGYPVASLISVRKRLIGTAEYGGHRGHGTVFRLNRF
jgi:uncharacterized repeat protein (TIGR03803 family)